MTPLFPLTLILTVAQPNMGYKINELDLSYYTKLNRNLVQAFLVES